MAAGPVAALHPAAPRCLRQVEEITQVIHVQLAHLSRKPLQEILRTTLVQVAHLNPWEVTAGLLRASPHCDR